MSLPSRFRAFLKDKTSLLSRFRAFLKDPTGRKRAALEAEITRREVERYRLKAQQAQRYLETRKAIREIEKKEKIVITPKPVEPEVHPIPIPSLMDEYVSYIDVTYAYRAGKDDSSPKIKRPTMRIYGVTRDSFDGASYLAEKHALYRRNGGAAWGTGPDSKVQIVGSGRKRR